MIHSAGGDSGCGVQFSPLLSFRRREVFSKGAVEGESAPRLSSLPLALAARQGDVAQVQDGQRMSLRVEHPVLQRK